MTRLLEMRLKIGLTEAQNMLVYFSFKNCKSPLVVVVHQLSYQPAITCSKLTIETLEQGVKYVQS